MTDSVKWKQEMYSMVICYYASRIAVVIVCQICAFLKTEKKANWLMPYYAMVQGMMDDFSA